MSSTVKTEPSSTIEIKNEPGAQHIYIIQTTDGTIPIEAGEVMVADETVYETVSALEQLSRGQVIQAENGELLQVYEEVVLPDGGPGDLVDVAEVEVGDGRSASPVKIGALTTTGTYVHCTLWEFRFRFRFSVKSSSGISEVQKRPF